MQSTVSETKVAPITFPVLRVGKTTGNIYLFTKNFLCICINIINKQGDCIGEPRAIDIMDTLPFFGSVTLSND